MMSHITDIPLDKMPGLFCYERGYQTSPLQLLIRLADYYQVSLDYLTGRSDQPRPLPFTEKKDKR